MTNTGPEETSLGFAETNIGPLGTHMGSLDEQHRARKDRCLTRRKLKLGL